MNDQERIQRIWASLPRENASDRKRSTDLYETEIRVLRGDPAPATRAGDWVTRVHELEQFARDHDRLPRREGGGAAEQTIAEWVHHQIQRKRSMSAYSHARLEAVRYWTWTPRGTKWEVRFHDLARFVEKNDRRPSRSAKDGAERSLAKWAQLQRDAGRAGKLSETQRRNLRDLGYPMPRS
jgi:hypothetical protein